MAEEAVVRARLLVAEELLALDYSSRFLAVQEYPGKGRGVVARRFIPAGLSIERAPVLIIPPTDRVLTDRTIIFTYVYMWEPGASEQELYSGCGRAAISLGFASLLNHSLTPNTEFIQHFDALEIELRSLRSIEAGEELTINYQMDLWFNPV